MQHAPFVHLHVHSYYSLLDGAAPVHALACRAAELRMPAMALTDHGNIFGAVEFYQTLQKAGVKPCIGCECYLLTRASRRSRDTGGEGSLSHLTLLVKNREGYKNLCRLITSSFLEGFYYKPRIDKELLEQYNAGLICLSGCLKGEISQAVLEGRMEDAERAAAWLSSVFKDNRFFLEVQDHRLPGQDAVKCGVVELGERMGIGLAATNDVHYIRREDAPAHDALLCIQTGKTLSDPKRMKLGTDEFYLKSAEEMAELFSDCPGAVSNTVSIAERLNLEFEFGKYHFPRFAPPEGRDLAAYLEERAREGLKGRWQQVLLRRGEGADSLLADYEKRLEEELKVIGPMGFAGYFLIVADFIGYARERGLPVGPGRGSAAGSLVAYCLGITNIDPLEHGLLFERFLNPERISMPDVDIDFCMRRRPEVIEYVQKKYGNVSQIITFGSMKARAAVRDVGRVMGLPYGDVDRIAKLIPAAIDMTLEKAIEIEPKLKELARS
ncbi:MAG TPA: DNA polymerase III subunit alpha, partial [bacterium]|nr:DNA polymerase III subunit alpha [bacterium]